METFSFSFNMTAGLCGVVGDKGGFFIGGLLFYVVNFPFGGGNSIWGGVFYCLFVLFGNIY